MARASQRSLDRPISELVGGGYQQFWGFKGRYRVVKGSRASKKSRTMALWIIWSMMKYPQSNVLVVRKVGLTHKDSTYAVLRWAVSRFGCDDRWIFRKSPMEIEYKPTGQLILFRGMDDPLKLSSITVPVGVLCFAWLEEAFEFSEDDFQMVDESIRGLIPEGSGLWKQITLTFNPWLSTSFLKTRFFDHDPDPDYLCMTTTYKCNEWLDDADAQFYERMRLENPRRYTTAGLGQWGASGESIFNEEIIAAQLARKVQPEAEMTLDVEAAAPKLREVRAGKGDIKIYHVPDPSHHYVIGADPAGDGSDYFAAHVWDNSAHRQVATFHRQKIGEHEFVSMLIALGYYYNTALIAVEVNFSSYATTTLQERGYPRQYVRERKDTYTGKTVPAYGFRTDHISREAMLSTLVELMDDAATAESVVDEATLYEMLTMVRNEKMRAEAEEGAHDDLVMSLAITLAARDQQQTRPTKKLAEPQIDPAPIVSASEMDSWTDRQKVLWRSASSEGKRQLLARWAIEAKYISEREEKDLKEERLVAEAKAALMSNRA